MDLRDHVGAHPYGTTWTMSYGGQEVMARKDYHTWTYKQGQLVQGICIPGITLYAPVTPTTGMSAVATTDDLSTPDPTAAAFGADDLQATNWRLVATSVVVTATIVGLFWLGLRSAGRAGKTYELPDR